MLKKILALFSTCALFHSCCNKSACNLNDGVLPYISVSFSNVSSTNGVAKIYIVYQGTVIDSLMQNAYYYGLTIRPYRFSNDPTVADKKFVIVHNSRSDTISNVSCNFYSEKVVCSTCWPSGTQYSTVWRANNLSYVCSGRTYSQTETLILED